MLRVTASRVLTAVRPQGARAFASGLDPARILSDPAGFAKSFALGEALSPEKKAKLEKMLENPDFKAKFDADVKDIEKHLKSPEFQAQLKAQIDRKKAFEDAAANIEKMEDGMLKKELLSQISVVRGLGEEQETKKSGTGEFEALLAENKDQISPALMKTIREASKEAYKAASSIPAINYEPYQKELQATKERLDAESKKIEDEVDAELKRLENEMANLETLKANVDTLTVHDVIAAKPHIINEANFCITNGYWDPAWQHLPKQPNIRAHDGEITREELPKITYDPVKADKFAEKITKQWKSEGLTP